MIETFKTKDILNPMCMENIFTERTDHHGLRSVNDLQLPKVIVGEMNLSKSGELGVTSFLSLWHMRSRVL